MRIHCLTTFLEGRDRYAAGDVRSVPDDVAARAIAAGWAEPADRSAPAAAPAAGATTLSIDNGQHGQEVRHG